MASFSEIRKVKFRKILPVISTFQMTEWVPVLILFMFFYSSCSWMKPEDSKKRPGSGRELVLQALKPVKVTGGIMSKSGVVSTVLSSSAMDSHFPLKELDPNEPHGGRAFNIVLRDGTRVGGLMFEYDDGTDNPQPLLMASFGFLQDRWGTEAAKFYKLYLENPKERIPCHVLLLDHPTAGPFLANNGHLSMGAYDDGRMWIEIAQRLRHDMDLTGVHLLGVSLSGQTVVHALIEDRRLGLGLFQSGMVFSIAPDFQQVPGKQLSTLTTPTGVENPWKLGPKTSPDVSLIYEIQGLGIWFFIKWQFIPHYQAAHPTGKQVEISKEDVAVFIRKACEDRLILLNEQETDTWNHKDFSLESLDAFMSSTRIAGVIDRVQTPLVLVSCLDDPAVEHSMFEEVKLAAMDNPWIAVYETDDGGHFGFDVVYGKDYVGQIIRLMLDPQVFLNWIAPKQ
jgi:hypothetical protein